jgi:predicted amidohydrolase
LLKGAICEMASPIMARAQTEAPLTLALLHLAPRPGEIAYNRQAIEDAVARVSAAGARFILSPELAFSGYGFRDVIGTDWIGDEQAARTAWASALARRASAVLALGMPEADSGGRLFNSLVLFGPDGSLLGRHRKINALRVGSESWSTPGHAVTSLAVEGMGRIGLFVCADMYSQRLVRETAALDVDLLVSCAAWAPGEHGPNGEWEWASRAAGRPVIVCNRSGVDVLDFRAARSVVAVDGAIVHAYESPEPAVVLVDWRLQARTLTNWRVAA